MKRPIEVTGSETFTALWVTETDTFRYEQTLVTRQIRDLPDHAVLIRVHYSSLNFMDALTAFGAPGFAPPLPHTPGVDAVGIVVEDSSGTFRSGDSVIVTGYGLGRDIPGGLAEYIRVPADWVVACPPTLSLREAMIYGTAGLTAALSVNKLLMAGARPEDGDIAVTGATGGVGSMAVALLARLGFSVAAITGKLESSLWLTQLGATKVIDRHSLDDISTVPQPRPRWGHGIDCLGGEFLLALVKSLRYGGSVAACGLASSTPFQASLLAFVQRNINLLGVDAVDLPLAEKERVWQQLGGEFKPAMLEAMAEEIPLGQVPQHLVQIHNGHALGRFLVKL